jgi:hypothetical protein
MQHDAEGWARELHRYRTGAEDQCSARADKYSEMFALASRVHAVPSVGNFMENFWEHVSELILEIIPYLRQGATVHAVAACASEDKEWATALCESMSGDGVKVVACDTEEEWALECDKASIVLPVLSQPFLFSPVCFKMMVLAHQQPEPRLAVLPVLRNCRGDLRLRVLHVIYHGFI